MLSIITERQRGLCLAALEIFLLLFYVIARFVDLSFLDLWVYWLALMFFWLLVLLFVASLKMFSTHRTLATIGLCMVAYVVLSAVLYPLTIHHT